MKYTERPYTPVSKSLVLSSQVRRNIQQIQLRETRAPLQYLQLSLCPLVSSRMWDHFTHATEPSLCWFSIT